MIKENKKTKRNVAIIVIGLILVVAVATLSYALWTRNFTETGVNKNIYDCFEISYQETNGNGVTLEHGYPQTDEQGMQNNPYEITVKNTCKTIATYDVILNKENSSTLDEQYLKVAVGDSYKKLSEYETTTTQSISGFNVGKSYIIGTGVLSPNSTKIIDVRSWMDENTSVANGANKEFTFKITIEATAGDGGLLAGKILTNNKLRSETPNFAQGYPNSEDTSLSGLYLDYDDDGDTYYFRGAVEDNYVQFGTSKENAYLYIVGPKNNQYIYGTRAEAEYECDSGTFGLDAVECKDAIVKVPMQTSGSPILWRIVRINGDGTIRLVIENPIGTSAFNTDCQDRKYVGYTYGNTPCTNASPCKSTYNVSGTFDNSNGGTNSTIKSYLESWYHRNLGKLDSKIAQTTYCNDTSYGSGDESGYLNYGADKRLSTDKKPSFKCPDPKHQNGDMRDYGGVYKLKVGILTADEMAYAGMSYNSPFATRDNYLLSYAKDNDYSWSMKSMSPSQSGSSDALELGGGTYGGIGGGMVFSSENVVRPVINLNSDVQITGGDGTESNPYIVD